MKQHPKNENNMRHKHGIKHNIHHHAERLMHLHITWVFKLNTIACSLSNILDVSFGEKTNFLNVSHKNTFRLEKKYKWNPRYFSFLIMCSLY